MNVIGTSLAPDDAAARVGGLQPLHLAGLTTLFWAYVTLSAVVYAEGLAATLPARTLFAPWPARLLQHLLLLPLLFGLYAVSLRIGWKPGGPRILAQLALAVAFALLANPAMWLAYECLEWTGIVQRDAKPHVEPMSGRTLPLWLSIASDFLIKYGFGLALVTGFANYKRLRDAQARNVALEQQVTASRLAALRMQLSPHTLFNLLHLIRGQIGWDPPAAQAMVMKLSDLLRRLLSAGERELAPLVEEVRFARLYLELQQQRFADRMTLAIPADDAVPNVWVPSLILQPLIENAVVHGMAGHEGAVRIELSWLVADSELTLVVVNTRSPTVGAGPARIGLANVRSRLAAQFGGDAAFVAGPDATGAAWRSEIRMPLLRDAGRTAAAAA